nr:MAG TPA: hypothetical protein [Caudoviricetes sp.]
MGRSKALTCKIRPRIVSTQREALIKYLSSEYQSRADVCVKGGQI